MDFQKLPSKTNKPTGVKKIKILIAIVDWNKADFYQDLIEQHEVNMQMKVHGKGTAPNEILQLLGLSNDKAVLTAVIQEDKEKTILQELNEKFEKVKNGKGIAFTFPMNSIIGVTIYQFLSNQEK